MKNKDSFTLIEILVAIFILSLIIICATSILYLGDLNWRRDSILLELQQKARIAMDRMSRELRQAQGSSITISNEGKNISFSIPDLLGGAYDINYYLDINSNQIIREYPAGTTQILGNNISSLNFSLSGDTLTITLQASKSLRGNPLSLSLKEKIKLRN
ncbi:MAG: hypothetical protein DRP61_05585 [Candidatus Omnitrophota bacterium]|nr:MAG: hypothetical protein DRP61_05585 [Candidatus Omnitrophota bacterium]RKY34775.1 MAG: hypothetical protein DRP69_03755 [Candidatus Omnitrophota bacterium]RKY44551.1 MAG: hypothetical protein DRP80_01760 [Candidatus Omnitrophota bacterium]